MKNDIIVDIDGTIADATHRLHHIQNGNRNWDAFFAECVNDTPHDDIIDLVWSAHLKGCAVHYVSGRSDSVHAETLAWLEVHELPAGYLYMRRHGDHRPDYQVKEEILDTKLQLTPEQVWFVLDDRDQVVEMWRRRGFRVLQVANGAF